MLSLWRGQLSGPRLETSGCLHRDRFALNKALQAWAHGALADTLRKAQILAR
jgi:hypothetical protein